MANTLYISYTGLMDPLGQSQVLQYVLGLAKKHQMTLLTFEKAANLADTERYQSLKARCESEGVVWHALTWHNKPPFVGTLFDIQKGIRMAIRIAHTSGVEVVHCRSYIAGLMGLSVKKQTGARFIFDMRGFWPDERVDGGIWSRRGAPYRIFKAIERKLFVQADHVVSLTKAGVREFSDFNYLKGRVPSVSVIPTCTNLELFKPETVTRNGFTLGYIGSVGSWYMFDDVARAVKRLFEMREDARFLVINKGNHAKIKTDLETAGVDMARVEIREAAFDEVATQVARMDAGIFFIKPAWSKRASCPTRMGEFLACGKPCLANEGVGDVHEDFLDTNTGITLPVTEDGGLVSKDMDGAIHKLLMMAEDPEIAERCRVAAEERFSLDGGIAEYHQIYQKLGGQMSKDGGL